MRCARSGFCWYFTTSDETTSLQDNECGGAAQRSSQSRFPRSFASAAASGKTGSGVVTGASASSIHGRLLNLGRDDGKCVGGTEDRDAVEGFEVAQVLVSLHDEICACSKRAAKYGIVVGIRCGARDRGWNDALGKRFEES